MATSLAVRGVAVAVTLAALGACSSGGGASDQAGPTTTTTTSRAALPSVTIGRWTGRRPATIYFSGDAGNIVTGLTWSTWDQDQAVGHGTRDVLGCVPDCASGTATPHPVTITMRHPVDGTFRTVLEQTADGKGTRETFTAPYLGQGACTTGDQESCSTI